MLTKQIKWRLYAGNMTDVYKQHATASGRRSTAKTSESDTRICGACNCTLHCCLTAVASFAHNARHDYHGFSVSSFTHNARHDCHMSWFVYSTAKTSESHTIICGASSCTLHCCPIAVSSFTRNAQHDYHGFSTALPRLRDLIQEPVVLPTACFVAAWTAVSSFIPNARHDYHDFCTA